MKLVLIEWDDPAYSGSHWENREPYIEKPVKCITCGIVLHEDRHNIHIVLNLNFDFYSQGIAVPKRLITRIRQLKV